jgi:chemotaxis protein methyltransferase CheR
MTINMAVKSVSRQGQLDIPIEEYKRFQEFLHQTSGIFLGDNKQYLVKSRLAGVLEDYDLNSFAALVAELRSGSNSSKHLKARVIDAMTTNETFWFRDDLHFIELKEKILPELFNKKTATFKIWSSACSSGQEPYSISMCVEEVLSRKTWPVTRNVQIIGTDISDRILTEAKNAVYSDLAFSRGLNHVEHDHYFYRVHKGYQLKAEITKRVRFQQFNLLKSFSVLGRFDVVFCRNVLIYFSEEVKRDILTRMIDSLNKGGYLFLSSTESLPNGLKEIEPVRSSRARYFKKL